MKEMKEKKTDHRTKYTKMVIRDAFQTLLKKKPIQKITIADICSAAEISRPTFYAHYEDIYALLDEIGENLLASANLREVTNLSIEKQDEITQAILNLVLLIKKQPRALRCVRTRARHRLALAKADHRRAEPNPHQKVDGGRKTGRKHRQTIHRGFHSGEL